MPIKHHGILSGIPRGLTGFVTTWETSAPEQTITLPLRSGYTYDMLVDWGDGSALSAVTAHNDADRVHEYAAAGTYTVTITGTCQAWYFANGGDRLKFRTVEHWGDVGFTGLGLVDAFWGCVNATSFGDEMPAYSVTSLSRTWSGCQNATQFPDVSALTGVTTLAAAWYDCRAATSFPAVNTLTNVENLFSAWYQCFNVTSPPAVSALTKVTTLSRTWYQCRAATSLPAVSTLTNVDTLLETWYDCRVATSFPAVSALTKVKTLYRTWMLCSAGTSFPAVSALTDVDTLHQTWSGCTTATSFPDVSALTKVTHITSAWYNCNKMTTVPAMPAASTALTTCTTAFQLVGAGMGGTVSDLWNAANFPNVTSYANCFTGCTGLANYGDIPNDWKGL